MKRLSTKNILKRVLFLLWVVVIAAAVLFYLRSGIPLNEYPERVQNLISDLGAWAPISYILFYTVRPLVFFPATVLTAASGIVFGPWLGLLYTIVGANLSANFAFLVGRYFGRHLVAERLKGMAKKLDGRFRENGFMTVLLMRLLFFPFDPANYLCGLSSVKHRDYAVATFLGTLPGSTTFVLLGSSFTDPINLILTGVAFLFGLVLSYALKKKHKSFANLKDRL